jgi:hypothetical protein
MIAQKEWFIFSISFFLHKLDDFWLSVRTLGRKNRPKVNGKTGSSTRSRSKCSKALLPGLALPSTPSTQSTQSCLRWLARQNPYQLSPSAITPIFSRGPPKLPLAWLAKDTKANKFKCNFICASITKWI